LSCGRPRQWRQHNVGGGPAQGAAAPRAFPPQARLPAPPPHLAVHRVCVAPHAQDAVRLLPVDLPGLARLTAKGHGHHGAAVGEGKAVQHEPALAAAALGCVRGAGTAGPARGVREPSPACATRPVGPSPLMAPLLQGQPLPDPPGLTVHALVEALVLVARARRGAARAPLVPARQHLRSAGLAGVKGGILGFVFWKIKWDLRGSKHGQEYSQSARPSVLRAAHHQLLVWGAPGTAAPCGARSACSPRMARM
jgi:hypothetical protein